MSGRPAAPLIEASTSSNGREDVSRNRSSSILLVIRLPLLFGGNKIAEGLGPCERCPKRSEGIEEPVSRRQRNLVDEILRGGEGLSVEGGDPARERVDEAVQLRVRK